MKNKGEKRRFQIESLLEYRGIPTSNVVPKWRRLIQTNKWRRLVSYIKQLGYRKRLKLTKFVDKKIILPNTVIIHLSWDYIMSHTFRRLNVADDRHMTTQKLQSKFSNNLRDVSTTFLSGGQCYEIAKTLLLLLCTSKMFLEPSRIWSVNHLLSIILTSPYLLCWVGV